MPRTLKLRQIDQGPTAFHQYIDTGTESSFGLAACDIDLVTTPFGLNSGTQGHTQIEFHYFARIAICEYKHENWNPRRIASDYTILLQRHICGDRFPLYVIRYADSLEWVEIYPANQLAAEKCNSPLNEPILRDQWGWCRFLYWTHGAVPSDETLARLPVTREDLKPYTPGTRQAGA